MPRTVIKYNDYKIKAFLDTNIILEGRPLVDLPWQNIDEIGPIIVLLTPTVIKEVDSKKQDGRIGKRAREFNKLIAPVAAGGPAIVLRESSPHVALALAYAIRIPWDQHDDLDPDDGDSCIVAEALHARGINDIGKVLVSHDIKPIAFAANYDLETFHVSDNWLREREPSPNDKEIQRLKSKIAEYQVSEPEFKIKVDMLDSEPIPVLRIEDLTLSERNCIEHKIIEDNPKINQINDFLSMTDSSYNDRYDAYLKRIPEFMEGYAQNLERYFNQTQFELKVSNTGKVQAENLLVEIIVSNGWLHDRYVFVSPSGPAAPKPKPFRIPHISNLPISSIHVGRHEVSYKEKPECRPSFSVTCEDFRHGQNWEFKGIIGHDPRNAEDTKIIVQVTASNFRGKKQEIRTIQKNHQTVHVSELIDLNTLRITRETPVYELIAKENYDFIDFTAFTDNDD